VIVKDAASFRTQGARCRRFARQMKYTHPDMARALTALAEEFDKQAAQAGDGEEHGNDQQKAGRT
jgi:hypothetical protein